MLNIKDPVLVVVDVQGKLAQLMYDRDALFKNIEILIKAAKILGIPILWCQQSPEALGPTVPSIAELLVDNEPTDKACFSCCGKQKFNDALNAAGRGQVLLCGIETHICVYQTAVDLLETGKQVHLIADAVSSRTKENKRIGIDRVSAEGAKIASVEMALFELLKTAEHPKFKQVAQLIK